MMNTAVENGRAFCTVRDAIEASGALTRPRGEHSLMASCPLHTDSNPSLSVTWRPRTHSGVRGGGVVLLHCFSCRAEAADIAAAIGLSMTDLFDAPLTRGIYQQHKPRPRRTITPRPQQRRAPDVKHDWKRVRVYRDNSSSRTWVWEKPLRLKLAVVGQLCRGNGCPARLPCSCRVGAAGCGSPGPWLVSVTSGRCGAVRPGLVGSSHRAILWSLRCHTFPTPG
jgi:hypothetical protein